MPASLLAKSSRQSAVIAAIVALTAIQALTLHCMGRVGWGESGFALWTSDALSSETSQRLADPYSFSHVLHGMIFYWLLFVAAPRLSIPWRFVLAVAIEVGWEILENSPFVIDRYRDATAALGYVGDSIVNSLGDTVCCAVGFAMAWRLPVKIVVALALLEELILLATIRDNLALNVLMLLFPIDSIKQWQLGA